MRWRREWKKIERGMASLMGKINVDDNDNQPLTVVSTYGSEGKHREAQLTSTLTLALALEKLMQHHTPDGRYLVTRKVHWQAIFRILVDRGIYPDGTDYRGFCCYIEEVFPTAECRVPLDYHSLKNISQTMFVRPFAEWRYDAVYGISRKSYERMCCIADTLDKQLSENFTRR